MSFWADGQPREAQPSCCGPGGLSKGRVDPETAMKGF